MINSLYCETVNLNLHAKSAILVESSTKKVLYDVINTVDAIKKVPKHIEKDLVDVQTNYKFRP